MLSGSWSQGGGQRLCPDLALQGAGQRQGHGRQWAASRKSRGGDIPATAKVNARNVPVGAPPGGESLRLEWCQAHGRQYIVVK